MSDDSPTPQPQEQPKLYQATVEFSFTETFTRQFMVPSHEALSAIIDRRAHVETISYNARKKKRVTSPSEIHVTWEEGLPGAADPYWINVEYDPDEATAIRMTDHSGVIAAWSNDDLQDVEQVQLALRCLQAWYTKGAEAVRSTLDNLSAVVA